MLGSAVMRVLLLTPWDNAWVPYFRDEFERRGATFALAKSWNGVAQHDLVLHGWANGMTQPVLGARNVMFLRRYELFDGGLSKVDWKHVDQLICVNTWIAERVREVFKKKGITVPVDIIYNGTDPARWTFKERKAGRKIGMACHIHPKKNLPLALQILAALPEGYELHIAGDVQDGCTAEYLNHVGRQMRRKVYLYGHVPHEQLNFWWETVDYCLSTSLSEGNPNNVIEAMAKGIKPVVHCWPGAEDQFAGHTFSTVAEAALMIQSGNYKSASYLALVNDKFSLANIKQVVDLALEPLMEAA
jgi:glycosyltransferase involved in cell wall biosynthesis